MVTVPKMRTINETAEITGLAAHFIRQLCLSGQIVTVKAGRKYLINLDRFIEFLNAAPAPAAPAEVGGIRRVEQ